jgi:hypothetical protein
MWQIGGSCLLDVDVRGNGVIIIGSYTSCFHVDVLSGLGYRTCGAKLRTI